MIPLVLIQKDLIFDVRVGTTMRCTFAGSKEKNTHFLAVVVAVCSPGLTESQVSQKKVKICRHPNSSGVPGDGFLSLH